MIENDDKRLPVPEATQRNRPDTADRLLSLSLPLTHILCPAFLSLISIFFGLEHQTHAVISCIYTCRLCICMSARKRNIQRDSGSLSHSILFTPYWLISKMGCRDKTTEEQAITFNKWNDT